MNHFRKSLKSIAVRQMIQKFAKFKLLRNSQKRLLHKREKYSTLGIEGLNNANDKLLPNYSS